MNPNPKNLYQRILESVRAIQSRAPLKPQVGVILGSGLGALAEQATDAVRIPYTEIPNFYGTSVEGHSSRRGWRGPAPWNRI